MGARTRAASQPPRRTVITTPCWSDFTFVRAASNIPKSWWRGGDMCGFASGKTMCPAGKSTSIHEVDGKSWCPTIARDQGRRRGVEMVV